MSLRSEQVLSKRRPLVASMGPGRPAEAKNQKARRTQEKAAHRVARNRYEKSSQREKMSG